MLFWKHETSSPLNGGKVGGVRDALDLTASSKPKEECPLDGKMSKYPLRTTGVLPEHAEVQLEK